MTNKHIPAFPSEKSRNPDGTWNQTYWPGMNMREYYAGQMMAALIQAYAARDSGTETWLAAAATEAVTAADLLLEALQPR